MPVHVAASRQVVTPATRSPSTRKIQRQAAANKRRAEKPIRDKVTKLEAELEYLTNDLNAVETRLAEPEVYHRLPALQLDELLAEAGRLRKKMDATEQAWLIASEALDKV